MVVDKANGPSSWFGEVAILQDVPRTASIKTSSDCSVFELKKSSLLELMEKYPSIRESVESTSQDRLQSYLMRSVLA